MPARLALLLCLLALAGCASTRPPGDPENICAIFREKPDWHDAALKVQEKWGAPVQVPIAMMYQESSFRHDALPPRYYFLGFIPWGRVSSAYGYAQAKDETWSDYKREAGGWFSSRDNFADSLDFMGWYMSKTQRINGVSKWDAYGQYLNYHEAGPVIATAATSAKPGCSGWRARCRPAPSASARSTSNASASWAAAAGCSSRGLRGSKPRVMETW